VGNAYKLTTMPYLVIQSKTIFWTNWTASSSDFQRKRVGSLSHRLIPQRRFMVIHVFGIVRGLVLTNPRSVLWLGINDCGRANFASAVETLCSPLYSVDEQR
jgi:hypothetical protein